MSGLGGVSRSNTDIHYSPIRNKDKNENGSEESKIKEISQHILINDYGGTESANKKHFPKKGFESDSAKQTNEVFDELVIKKSYEYGRIEDDKNEPSVKDQSHQPQVEKPPSEVQEGQNEDEVPLENPDYQIDAEEDQPQSEIPASEVQEGENENEVPLENPDYQLDVDEDQLQKEIPAFEVQDSQNEDEIPLENPDYQIDAEEDQTGESLSKIPVLEHNLDNNSELSDKLNVKNGLAINKITYNQIDKRVDLNLIEDVKALINSYNGQSIFFEMEDNANFKMTNDINKADFVKNGNNIIVLSDNPDRVMKAINNQREKLGIPKNQPLTFYIVDSSIRNYFISELSKIINLGVQTTKLGSDEKLSNDEKFEKIFNDTSLKPLFTEILLKRIRLEKETRKQEGSAKILLDEKISHEIAVKKDREEEKLQMDKEKLAQIVEHMYLEYQRALSLVKGECIQKAISKEHLHKEFESWVKSMTPFPIRMVTWPVIWKMLQPVVAKEIQNVVEIKLKESQLMEETPPLPSSQTPNPRYPKQPPLDTRMKKRRLEG